MWRSGLQSKPSPRPSVTKHVLTVRLELYRKTGSLLFSGWQTPPIMPRLLRRTAIPAYIVRFTTQESALFPLIISSPVVQIPNARVTARNAIVYCFGFSARAVQMHRGVLALHQVRSVSQDCRHNIREGLDVADQIQRVFRWPRHWHRRGQRRCRMRSPFRLPRCPHSGARA